MIRAMCALVLAAVALIFIGNSASEAVKPYTESRLRNVTLYDVDEVYDDYDNVSYRGSLQDNKLGFVFYYPITTGQFTKFVADGKRQDLQVHASLNRLGYDKSPSGKIFLAGAAQVFGWIFLVIGVIGLGVGAASYHGEKEKRRKRNERDRRYRQYYN